MRFRVKKKSAAKGQVGTSAQPNPRSIPNPYGRLFTKDKSFADLLPRQQGKKR